MSETSGNAAPASTPSAASLSREGVLAALDSEIKRLEEENKRPGWSNWALLGGLATMIWLVLAEYSPKANLSSIAVVFLFASLVTDFCVGLYAYVKWPSRKAPSKPAYCFIGDEPSASPLLLIFVLTRSSILLWVYYPLASTLHIYALVAYCLFCIGGASIVLLMRQFKVLFLPRPLSPTTYHFVNWVMLVWHIAICISLLKALPLSESTYKTSEFRIGFLLAGMVFLVGLVVASENERPIIDALKDIRRDLHFGGITSASALRSSEMLLFGIDANAASIHYVNDALAKMELACTYHDTLLKKCQVIDEALSWLESESNRESSEWRDKARSVANLIGECDAFRSKGEIHATDAFFAIKSFARFLTSATHLAPLRSEERTKWLAFGEKRKECTEKATSFLAQWNAIKSRFVALPKSIDGTYQ